MYDTKIDRVERRNSSTIKFRDFSVPLLLITELQTEDK